MPDDDNVKTYYNNNTWKLGAENTCREGFRIRDVNERFTVSNKAGYNNIVGDQPVFIKSSDVFNVAGISEICSIYNAETKTRIYLGEEKEIKWITKDEY